MHSSPGRPSRARGEPSAWTGTERGSRFIVRCSLTKDSRTYRCDGHGCGLNGTCVPSGPPSRVVPAHPSLSLPTGHTVPVRTVVLCVGGRGAPMPGTEVRALGPYHRAPSTGGAGALSVPAPQVLESTYTFQHRAPSYSIFSTEKTLLASLLSTKILKLVLII